jgi:hypothetical protein
MQRFRVAIRAGLPFNLVFSGRDRGQDSQPMRESALREGVNSLLKVTVLWMVLLSLPFIERTLLGAKTFYLLYGGLALVFVAYGLTIRSLFFFLQQVKREPVYVWIGFFVCRFSCVAFWRYSLSNTIYYLKQQLRT